MKKMKNIRPLDEQGKPHGVWKEFFSNGKIFELTTFNHGSRNGLFERYYSNGDLNVRCNYLNGERHGLYERRTYLSDIWEKEYYSHGKLFYEIRSNDRKTFYIK